MKITVIDYGLSNLLSVRRAFEYFGAEVEVTGSRSRILSGEGAGASRRGRVQGRHGGPLRSFSGGCHRR